MCTTYFLDWEQDWSSLVCADFCLNMRLLLDLVHQMEIKNVA